MTDHDRTDELLASLFAAPPAPPDEAFVARVERIVAAEQRLAAARARAWHRFRGETVAGAAVIASFALLWRLAPAEPTLQQLSFGPAAAALLLLFFWFGIELRPAATGR